MTYRVRPHRGEVWLVDLDPFQGHEQGGTRPGLIVSEAAVNNAPSALVTLVPITSRDRGISGHVVVSPPVGGLDRPSWIICEQIRTVTQQRLRRHLGELDTPTLQQVETWLRVFLGL